ncbi:unnamed protein product [Camellia sinensis]
MLKETSTKKSRISNGVSKKEVKTSQTVGVVEEEKKLETRISKGVSSKLIKREKNKEGRHSRKQTNAMKFQNKEIDPDIPLPQGTELTTTVAGIDLPPEAVGHAMQFLEFCAFDEKKRSWIEDQNSKFAEKEKQLKQKMKDEVAKAVIAKNGVPLSIFEHEAIVSQIKTEAAQAHTEMESKGMLPKGMFCVFHTNKLS